MLLPWLLQAKKFFKSIGYGDYEGIDFHINNFTALSVVGVLQYAFRPLALFQILQLGNYLKIYTTITPSPDFFLYPREINYLKIYSISPSVWFKQRIARKYIAMVC